MPANLWRIRSRNAASGRAAQLEVESRPVNATRHRPPAALPARVGPRGFSRLGLTVEHPLAASIASSRSPQPAYWPQRIWSGRRAWPTSTTPWNEAAPRHPCCALVLVRRRPPCRACAETDRRRLQREAREPGDALGGRHQGQSRQTRCRRAIHWVLSNLHESLVVRVASDTAAALRPDDRRALLPVGLGEIRGGRSIRLIWSRLRPLAASLNGSTGSPGGYPGNSFGVDLHHQEVGVVAPRQRRVPLGPGANLGRHPRRHLVELFRLR